MGKLTSGIVEEALTAAADEKGKLSRIFKRVASHPVKMIAAFFAAPFLMLRIAWSVKNQVRRFLAIVGLIVAFLMSYVAGTFLGSIAGAALIASKVGYIMALGFLVGTTLSMILSVTFCVFVFNFVSFIFLKMNTQEVIDHLHDISS